MPTEPIIYKTCSRLKCRMTLPSDHFGVNSTRCKPCVNAKAREYRQTTRGREICRKIAKKCWAKPHTQELSRLAKGRFRLTKKSKDYMREYGRKYEKGAKSKSTKLKWRQSTKGAASRFNSQLKTRHGINAEKYASMVVEQDGKCAICRRVPERTRLYIDHDHQNGRVRGLLCSPCNMILGKWSDSPETAERAKQYLLKHRQLKLAV